MSQLTRTTGKYISKNFYLFGTYENTIVVNKSQEVIMKIATPFSIGTIAVNNKQLLIATGFFSLNPKEQPDYLPIFKLSSEGKLETNYFNRVEINSSVCGLQWASDNLLVACLRNSLVFFDTETNEQTYFSLYRDQAIELKVYSNKIFVLYTDGYIDVYSISNTEGLISINKINSLPSTEELIREENIALEIENEPYLSSVMDISSNVILRGDNNGYIYLYPYLTSGDSIEIGEGLVSFISNKEITTIKSISGTGKFLITDANGVIYLFDPLEIVPTVISEEYFIVNDIDLRLDNNQYEMLLTHNNGFRVRELIF